jgi:hypothetical protein
LRFDHFGNWHEDVAGLDWAGYLARRPGALRETIRRRLRRAEKLPAARFSLLSQPADMDEAAEVFEAVYARSWKEPEPFPRFNVALMRVMAAAGLLRFGAWWVGATPVAVQVWVQEHGHATVLKLAHDEAFKAHSPGTVLTALMLRHLLDQEHVTEIDFGRGDDDYKQGCAAAAADRAAAGQPVEAGRFGNAAPSRGGTRDGRVTPGNRTLTILRPLLRGAGYGSVR